MPIERTLRQAKATNDEIIFSPQIQEDLEGLVYLRNIDTSLQDFEKAARQRKKLDSTSQVRKLFDFRFSYYNAGLESAIESSGSRGGIPIYVIIPPIEF